MGGRKGSMSFTKPCVGLFLQGGVKALSLVEAGLNVALLFIGTTAVVNLLDYEKVQEERKNGDWSFYARQASLGFSYIYGVTSIFESQRLFKYASKRDYRGLSFCTTVAGVMHALYILDFTLYTIFVQWSQPATMTAYLGYMLYKCYFFWVTICFMREIKGSQHLNPALRQLSDEEVEQLLKGNPLNCQSGSDINGQPCKWDFEIPLSRLEFEEHPLGKGAFGIVYSALLKQDNIFSENLASVAVKTVACNSDVIYFKALLSELKIMTYVGYHENIVNLIGACTSEIKRRQLYVIVELCHLGNIRDYLQKNQEDYQASLWAERLSKLNPNENNNYVTARIVNGTATGGISTLDLLRWSLQTASGMEFIASKKVIHGDLAARNVLLTMDKQIKISDFGLSRQLYKNYSTYVKTQNEPFPWTHMAVEALCDFNYSSMSDVWSFGVTVWEYFSCGSVPYPGWNYSEEFIKYLKCGQLYPDQPGYACDDTYAILKECWRLEPKLRLSFTQLKQYFEGRVNQYVRSQELRQDFIIISKQPMTKVDNQQSR